MRSRKLLRFVRTAMFAVLAAVIGAPLAHAQGVTTGAIAGVVADAQGAVVPGATVTAVHQPSGTSYEAVTQADGRFVLPGIARRRTVQSDRDAHGVRHGNQRWPERQPRRHRRTSSSSSRSRTIAEERDGHGDVRSGVQHQPHRRRHRDDRATISPRCRPFPAASRTSPG